MELLDNFLSVLERHRPALPVRFLPERAELTLRRALTCLRLPVLDWLARLEPIASPEARPLITLLRGEDAALAWRQTYGAGDFGEAFLRNYGWLEVFGSRGCFAHSEIAGGLLLLGAQTHYPDHRHVAEEIYIPLTGRSEWRMGGGAFQAREPGEIIHHASNVSHAMRTGPEPLLALYLWRGGPLDQKSEIVDDAQTPSQARSG